MKDVYIVGVARTPIGRFGGALKDHSSVDLASIAMQAAIDRSGIAADRLDFYTMGNILSAGQGQLIPRQAASKAGIPDDIDGYAVDMVCSSGMMSVMSAATAIRAGEADLVLAGGTESMSNAGFYFSSRARWGYKLLMGKGEELVDLLIADGLTDPLTGEAMGLQAESVAKEHGIDREALDRSALRSHERAAAAQESGDLDTYIVPIAVKRKRETVIFDKDEGVRADSTLEALAKLRPAFSPDGLITAGNASQISDGAAAVVLASGEAVKHMKLTPLARILGSSIAAGESRRFTEAPIPAVRRLLERLKMAVHDFDLIENNEAFAINTLLFERLLEVNPAKQNVFGGAVALGHPIGASGARIIVTLLNALKRRDRALGLASICHGTGGGTAMALERM